MGSWWSTDSGNTPGDSSTDQQKPTTINLGDPIAVKRSLDEAASEAILQQGYAEDVSNSNLKLGLGFAACAMALMAQFFPWKFPGSQPLLLVCIFFYVILNGALQLVAYLKEKNHILFTHPLAGSVTQTGLAISSSLPRFSDKYTLMIGSSDPKSIAARPSVTLTKSVASWFRSDGTLAESIFLSHVQGLLDEYRGEARKTK